MHFLKCTSDRHKKCGANAKLRNGRWETRLPVLSTDSWRSSREPTNAGGNVPFDASCRSGKIVKMNKTQASEEEDQREVGIRTRYVVDTDRQIDWLIIIICIASQIHTGIAIGKRVAQHARMM